MDDTIEVSWPEARRGRIDKMGLFERSDLSQALMAIVSNAVLSMDRCLCEFQNAGVTIMTTQGG